MRAVALWETFAQDGEYDVKIESASCNPVELTFIRNKNNDYELSKYQEWMKDDWEWVKGLDPTISEGLQNDCHDQAMYHFVGALRCDFPMRYGIGVGTVAVTNIALSESPENEEFLIKYFPEATLQIEPYTEEWSIYKPQSWIIKYADSSKNITVGKDGSDVITITDDLIGIYNVDEGRYVVRFEKYRKP